MISLKSCILVMSVWMILPELYCAPNDVQRRQPISLFVLVDGDSGRYADSMSEVVDLFRAGMRRQDLLRIALFDKMPDKQTTAPLPIESPILPLLPRTPLKDAVEVCLGNMNLYPNENAKAIVILLRDESYGSWISTRRLEKSAQKLGVRICAITLEEAEHKKLLHRIGAALTWPVISMFDDLADNPVPSRSSTHHMLSALSASSGGTICRARDESAVIGCADQIFAEIIASTR